MFVLYKVLLYKTKHTIKIDSNYIGLFIHNTTD